MPPAFSIAVVSSLTAVGRACDLQPRRDGRGDAGGDHLAIVAALARVTALPDPLAPLLDLPGVADAVDRARSACEELRWHEAYRRRWREVRAEAGSAGDPRVVRGRGRAGAAVAGAVAGHRRRAATPVVVGALRATAPGRALDARARRPRAAVRCRRCGQLLAQVHVAARPAGWLPDGVRRAAAADRAARGPARSGSAPVGDELAARVELLGRTVRESAAPALVVAGRRARGAADPAAVRRRERGGRPGRGAAAADRARPRPDRVAGAPRSRLGRGAQPVPGRRRRGSRRGRPTGSAGGSGALRRRRRGAGPPGWPGSRGARRSAPAP